ncbi:hypothetical protein [Streptomyces flavofungini]|uniref:hypothetical protein n=1 Tax=Streptomyces flavofungini TaxID=68200 RepID=UPI0025B1DAAF|nr:hypothetical protein [Streptomyces flavofungini]WJV48894.1 hypothetical protein QUY26_27305 [Streptomyces flavofungini]
MDPGTVSLLAAGIGGTAGVLGGAVGAFLSSRFQLKIVREQLSHDHHRWLRQEGLASYASLLAAYHSFTTAVSPVTGPSRKKLKDHLPEINKTEYVLVQAQAQIRFVGTVETEKASRKLCDAVVHVADTLRRKGTSVEVDESVTAVCDAYDAFVTAVKSAIAPA